MRRYSAIFILCIFCALLFHAVGCATRSAVWDLEDRVDMLSDENARLRQALSEKDAGVSDRAALKDEISDFRAIQKAELYDIRTEMRRIGGSIEEIEYRLDRDVGKKIAEISVGMKRNAARLDDYEKRLSRLEVYLGMEAAERPRETEKGEHPDREALEGMEEEALYQAVKQMFDDGEYDGALDGFELFLERFPGSSLADNSRFWTGEVYFAEEWYERAIVEYQKVIDDYPDGNKVPDAYLKQGIAFSLLGEKDNAVYLLRELVRKFPDHNAAEIAKSRIEALEQ